MRVLLLGFTKIKYMPYMHFYLDKLKDSEVHLFYWDRDNKPDVKPPEDVIIHKFTSYQEDSEPLYKKIGSFMRYRKEALRVIHEDNFDLIIVLHSTTGVVIYDILTKKFKNKYILDYRDVTYEHNRFYKRIIHQLVKNSIATFVSSNDFRKLLPKKKSIYTSHNYLKESLEYRNIRRKHSRISKPIRIRYWGLIRHEKVNELIIQQIANDKRFELHYHGREQKTAKRLKEYSEKIGAENVFFHGEYEPEERYLFASETDILHNIFENDRTMQPAMSNKFYDGIMFYIPQLCSENSFMGSQTDKYGVGFSCDPNSENFTDEIYSYIQSIDFSEFDRNCDCLLNEIIKDYNIGRDVIESLV